MTVSDVSDATLPYLARSVSHTAMVVTPPARCWCLDL